MHRFPIGRLPILHKYLESESQIPNLYPLSDLFPAFYNENLHPPNLKMYVSPYDWSLARKRFITRYIFLAISSADWDGALYTVFVGDKLRLRVLRIPAGPSLVLRTGPPRHLHKI